MKALSQNWIVENLIDFEYKKYELLGYLQGIKQEFRDEKLYPALSDLIAHYNNLITIKNNKQQLSESFGKSLSKIDFDKLKLIYESIEKDNQLINEIENIIDFSIPQLESHLKEGKDIYNTMEGNMQIEPIGLTPLNPNEGYMFINDGKQNETYVHQYNISFFEHANENFRGIHTSFITSFAYSYINTFESIKIQLIKEKPLLPNPAVFAISSQKEYPLTESFIPIAKRTLVRYISTLS
ncbi:MAG: hypothetical protein K8R85_02165 [Bacteroidetes bacterium]|nr:hypothetical protein [Bacteroidota bacterium]